MASQPQAVPTPGAPEKKAKRKRSPSVAKPAFFVIQIVDDAGNPVPFDKRRVKLLRVERNAETVMEMMDNTEYPNAFYLRGIVPVARVGQPRAAQPSQPAVAA
jgi:hypothetical protein